MAGWKRIDASPPPCVTDRVLVAGWQKESGNSNGYWWWHEDFMVDGKPTDHPDAVLWCEIVIPAFPPDPGMS